MHFSKGFISILLAVVVLGAGVAHAEGENSLAAARAFFAQGQYHRAINMSRELLADTGLGNEERFELLRLLAESEEQLVAARGYEDAGRSIRAYEHLHKEFPERFKAVQMHWKVAWLSWNQRKYDQADSNLQAIIQEYPHAPEAKRAAVLHARYLIQRNKFQAARATLLRFFGLGSGISEQEEAEAFAWLAVIDEAEGNRKQAYRNMRETYGKYPAMIEEDSFLHAVYIRLLSIYEDRQLQMLHILRYVKRHVSQPEALQVRLLQADILLEQGHLREAETIYGILSTRRDELAVGKQAYLRLLMLQNRDVEDAEALKKVLNEFSLLAASNQLSEVEGEAVLYKARILLKLSAHDEAYLSEATAAYAIAAAGLSSRFSEAARHEGSDLLARHMQKLLQQEQWLPAVVLWKRYPQLRPADSKKLAFSIAQAYIRLMDFTHAEELLDQLYAEAGNSVWAQRLMLEKARLWAERNDPDGVEKIMQWLAGHEKTLYRQDLLLIVARIQNVGGNASEASQTLANINAADLTPELRQTYWLTKAAIHQNLKRWHIAAEAWRQLAELSEEDGRWRYVQAQADALIESRDYAEAEAALLKVPESAQQAAWHYAMALCALNTGRWKTAREHLEPLAASGSDKDYQLRARLLLAQEEADQAKRERQ